MNSFKVILIALSALVVAFDGSSIKPYETFFRISLYSAMKLSSCFYVNLPSIKMDSVLFIIYFIFSINRAALLGHLIAGDIKAC